ncbi:hypothetical protein SAMN05216598_4153 [Pseudomonas asplenii]|uniref:Uncharacterized protein n=1 Tax=Pseudomonas asplenii TaxID=53407 RepID=A0A1H1Y036_9PSED|nr:hypothetical protein [Pseudomonas asplenii]SDT14715.1 hypothetical protein SAMN05216598_4153 [Pseudomonas asplenii]
MQLDFDPRLHVDWKIPGGELLALFQHYYPEISVFAGAQFETLLDELSNEMVEVCLEALAPLLAQQGYDLWNLDAEADDYRPVIIPIDQRKAFARYWQKARSEPRLTAALIEPQQSTVPEVKKTPAKRRKLNWLAQVHNYPGSTYVDENHYRNGWASITEQDEESGLCLLIDYNPWPPTEQDMLEHRTDGADGADLQLIHASSECSLWKRRVKIGDRSGEDLFRYETCRGHVIQPFGIPGRDWPQFEGATLVMDWRIFERQRLYEPESVTRIWRITEESSEVIFEHPNDVAILQIGPRRLLFMQYNGPSCWIWDEDRPGQAMPARPMPAKGAQDWASCLYLGNDEVLLFDQGQRQNLEDSGWAEWVLEAWRFNFVTGRTAKAVLDGFGSEVRQQTQYFVTQPKRTITLRTFHGKVQACRGHGDWWVLNYQSNTFGTRTRAWFWNQSSNQVLKLSSRDIPRVEPTIRYLPAQDHYLAFERDFVARLPTFAEMLEAKGCDVLTFE